MHLIATLLLFLDTLQRCSAFTASTSQTTSINWFPCKQNASIPISCGTLAVPLDYTTPSSNETIELQLVKVNATTQPSNGSILFNPGGPGEPGRNFITGDVGKAFLIMTGGNHDLIAFDTRGTGETIPFSCYATSVERMLANLQTPSQLDASNTALGTIWAARKIMADKCHKAAGNIGELIGTAFVARDMMRIVDALGEDGLLRYWGFSYGTALGGTVAAMFPERMDKVVLDGVLNLDQYYAGRDVQEVVDADATFAGFFSGCVKTPKLCALARNGISSEALSRKIKKLLETVKFNPIPLGPEITTDLVDYRTVKTLIELALYTPREWPNLASAFDAIFSGNVTAYRKTASTVLGVLGSPGPYPQLQGSEVLQGIRCSDSTLRTDNLTDLLPLLQRFQNASTVLGDQQPAAILMSCAQWKMNAKERYTGGFHNIKTKNPLLFVGNTHDPMTPLASARNVSAGFPGSAVLGIDIYGHTSTSQPSLCAAKAIRAYFTDGTLPEPDKICQSSVSTFMDASVSFLDSAKLLIPNSTESQDDEEQQDTALLAATVHIGQKMPMLRFHF